jgi:hypothetical protein
MDSKRRTGLPTGAAAMRVAATPSALQRRKSSMENWPSTGFPIWAVEGPHHAVPMLSFQLAFAPESFTA